MDFGLGSPSQKTKQAVQKYTEETLGAYQNAVGKLQTVLQTAFVKDGKELVYKQLGTSAKDASSEVNRLNDYLERYRKIINTLPKVTEGMHVKEAKGLFDAWMNTHQGDQFIRAKNGAIELESVFKYANSLSLATNDEIISFFNTIQNGALAAADRVERLEEVIKQFSQSKFSAANMEELLGSNQFAEVLMQRIPEEMRNALASVNQELEANGVEAIDVDRLIRLDPDAMKAYINESLRGVMQEIEVVDSSGAGTAALKFTADVSPESQEELRASIAELVANVTAEAFPLRFVADTSAEGLAHFSESLNAFSQINNGQPIEVAITAGSSQEAVDKLTDSIRVMAEQVEGKEFHVNIAPADGAVEALRQQVEQGFEAPVGVKLSVADAVGNTVDVESISDTTNAIQQHIDAVKEAIAVENEKKTTSEALVKALDAEAAAVGKAERRGNTKKTDDEKAREKLEKEWADKNAAREREQAAKQAEKSSERAMKADARAAKQAEASSLSYGKLTNKVTTYFHKFEDEIKKNPELMAQYEQLLNNLNTQSFDRNMTQAAAAVQKFQIACEQAGVGTNSFIKKIVSGFGNKLLYGGLARAAAEIRKLVRQIYQNVTEIDAAATQLRIVTNGSADDMRKYYDDASASAKRLAVSIKDVINATTVYARLGYSASESNVLAEYTSMLTKVGDIDTSAATDAVTALVKAFDLDLSDVQLVMDQMVEVGKQNCPTAWRHAA